MMNRRKFLRNSSIAGATLSAATFNAGILHARDQFQHENAGFWEDEFSLNEATISDLQQKMTDGALTSRQLTSLYLQRIEAMDKKGPAINAVIELNPDAIAIAEAMDMERKTGKLRGPMHGIPILIKDNIDTADKMMTTAGSLAMIGNIAKKDAFVVEQLRKAGAVILGKTNLSEWANFRSERSSSGWSSRGGQTKNACVLDRDPSGSSSGSGAAVAANFCVVAVGTETDGSIIAPSSQNGIVGIKPTVGLVSRSGIIPISATQDTAGPMARTVMDAAILLSAMAGIDNSDPASKKAAGKPATDYSKNLTTGALQGKRMGVEKAALKGHEAVVKLMEESIQKLKDLGATIVEIDLVSKTQLLGDAEYDILQYEFKDGLNHYLKNAGGKVKSIDELIAFNETNAAQVMPYFQQEILVSSAAKESLESDAYKKALAKSTSAAKLIDDMLTENRLDAICGVSIGPAGCIDLVNWSYSTGFYFPPPAAMAGYPHITIPMGNVHELPVGLSFIGTAFSEAALIAFAYEYEQATKHRKKPLMLPSLRS